MKNRRKLSLIISFFLVFSYFFCGCNATPHTFTVTYISDDNVFTTQIISEGETVILPPKPIKNEYDFCGWFYDANDYQDAFEQTVPIKQDITLYAKWEKSITEPDVENKNEIESRLNIAYGTHERQTMDIYLPPDLQDGEKRCAVLTLHGGNWLGGTKGSLNWFKKIILETGCIYVDMDYRVIGNGADADGKAPYVNMMDDVQAALEYLYEYAVQYHINTESIALAGYSSGATIALTYAYTRRYTSIPVNLVVSMAGPTNFLDAKTFTPDGELWLHAGHEKHSDIYVQPKLNLQQRLELISAYVGTAYATTNWQEAWSKASPAFLANNSSPHTLIFCGNEDNVVPFSHAELLAEKLTSFEIFELCESGHFFTQNDLDTWNLFFTSLSCNLKKMDAE